MISGLAPVPRPAAWALDEQRPAGPTPETGAPPWRPWPGSSKGSGRVDAADGGPPPLAPFSMGPSEPRLRVCSSECEA